MESRILSAEEYTRECIDRAVPELTRPDFPPRAMKYNVEFAQYELEDETTRNQWRQELEKYAKSIDDLSRGFEVAFWPHPNLAPRIWVMEISL